MARWKPKADEPVGANEAIGRRLFDEPMLIGAQDQRPYAGLNLRHFQETRSREFSVDRLGRAGIEKPVLDYVLLRAEAASKKFTPPKPFHGWAWLKAKEIQQPKKGSPLPVMPSPIAGSELDENLYHGHILLPSVGDYLQALHLRHLFTTYGEVKVVEQAAMPTEPTSPLLRISDTLRSYLKRWGF